MHSLKPSFRTRSLVTAPECKKFRQPFALQQNVIFGVLIAYSFRSSDAFQFLSLVSRLCSERPTPLPPLSSSSVSSAPLNGGGRTGNCLSLPPSRSRPLALSPGPAARPRLYGRKIKQILFKQEISCESERSLSSSSLSFDPSNAPQTSKVQFVLFTSIASDFSVKEKAGEEQEAESGSHFTGKFCRG